MAKFNADEVVKALMPPSITVGGEEYVGKLLTVHEMAKLLTEMKQYEEGLTQGDADSFIKSTEIVCDAVGIPAEKVLNLPQPVALKAVESFLDSLKGV